MPDQVHPEVAELVGLRAGEPAHQRDRHRDAHRGGHEVLHRQPGHLHQVAHRGLARVVLPVGVGGERRRGVPRQRRLHVGQAEAEPQVRLHPLEQVQEQHRHRGERQHRPGVHAPGLLGVRVDAHQPVDDPLGPQVPLAGHRPVHVVAERPVHHGQRDGQHHHEDDPGGSRTHQKRSGNSRATTRNTVNNTASTKPAALAALTASPPLSGSGRAPRTPRSSAARTPRQPFLRLSVRSGPGGRKPAEPRRCWAGSGGTQPYTPFS